MAAIASFIGSRSQETAAASTTIAGGAWSTATAFRRCFALRATITSGARQSAGATMPPRMITVTAIQASLTTTAFAGVVVTTTRPGNDGEIAGDIYACRTATAGFAVTAGAGTAWKQGNRLSGRDCIGPFDTCTSPTAITAPPTGFAIISFATIRAYSDDADRCDLRRHHERLDRTCSGKQPRTHESRGTCGNNLGPGWCQDPQSRQHDDRWATCASKYIFCEYAHSNAPSSDPTHGILG